MAYNIQNMPRDDLHLDREVNIITITELNNKLRMAIYNSR